MAFKGIILHWTAGISSPTRLDKERYHFIFDNDGVMHVGRYKPEDNLSCTDGKYAAHTGGGNTGRIGLAVCGAKPGSKFASGAFIPPYSRHGLEAMLKYAAFLCKKYSIPIENVLTHYEFGLANPNTTSRGKVDIDWLPYTKPGTNGKPFAPGEVGDEIRGKIRWYYEKM